MGPPHVRGGDSERHPRACPGHSASMGPPHVRGGDVIQELSKLPLVIDASMGPPHVRGGDLVDALCHLFEFAASMGPPHVRGGDSQAKPPTPWSTTLQWGRRMFAAETDSWTGGAARAGWLQWGRRMFAAETRYRRRPGAPRSRASMGPPHVRGGDPHQAGRVAHSQAASMGPPHVRGGDLLQEIDPRFSLMLQWGRRMFAAETRWWRWRAAALSRASMGPPHVRGGDVKLALHPQDVSMLQWGRRMFAAETSPGRTHRLASTRLQWGRRMFAAETATWAADRLVITRCFNGAAACSRRRRDGRPGCVRARGRLQWGRRMFAAETSGAPMASVLVTDASMGPPHVRGGDKSTPRPSWRPTSAFNGAAACSRRRPRSRRSPSAAPLPSMGPPHVRGGDLASAQHQRCSRSPFNGAAACSRRRQDIEAACERLVKILQWGRRMFAAETSE